MTDTTPTDDLRRRIAERLGYYYEPATRGPKGDHIPIPAKPGDRIDGYNFFAPDGTPVEIGRYPLEHQGLPVFHGLPDWENAQPFPDWPGDADAALALPIPPGYGWVLFRLGENYHARLTTTGEVMRTAREAWSPDGVAAAIAEAWGQWMDAKGEG